MTGWFDSRRSPGPLTARIDSTAGEVVVCIAAPGIRIWVDTTRATWTCDDDKATIVCGLPHPGAVDRPNPDAGRIGADEVPRNGHAVVQVDAKQASLTLRTDRFGIRPLCYRQQGAMTCFSDRADALPAALPPEVDAQAIFDYVYFHVIPAPRTIFRGVYRLPPARALRVDRRGANLSATWRPEFAPAREVKLDALAERFRAAIAESVRREASDPNTGAFLSGGTDSSTVAGMLCKVRGAPAATFSIGFEDEAYDEMAYARVAARHFGTDHHEYYVTPGDLLAHIPVVAAHYDQPFGNSSALPAYCCARLARAQGITKLLAGDGGDELFGGNKRYAKQKIFEAYHVLPESMRAGLLEPLLAGGGLAARMPLVSKAASYVSQARVPMPNRMETYNLLQRFGAAEVFSTALLRQVDTGSPSALQRTVYDESAGADLVNRMLVYDWRFTLADTDLPKVTGTTSIAALRVGFPLLADELVDLSLKLPPSMKVRGLRLRWFFKEALKEFLPREIILKEKHGFGLPFGPWLVRHPELRNFARESISRLVDRNVTRPQFADDLFSARLAEHAGYYGEMVWILMMLEQWLSARAPGYRVTEA